MSKKVVVIGNRSVDVIGRFQLKVNRDPKRFRITNINSFVPFGKGPDDRMKFRTQSGLVESLVIDKLIVTFSPDNGNELDLHNVNTLIQHPDVRLDGMSDEEHKSLVQKNLKKSNPKFILTNIDKIEDESFEKQVKLINLRSQLFSDSNPLTKEMLVYLASNFGIPYKNDISEPERYRRYLLKRIDSYIQLNEENRTKFKQALENVKMTEMVYYLNEFEELGIVSQMSGIYKIQDKPIGASRGKLIEYFEQNPSDFQAFKEEVIRYNSGKIYS